jgi:uncharacterized protein YrzB (UPF0473 family)
MKKIIFFAIFAMMSMCFSGCSGYDEMDEMLENIPSDDNPNGNDDNNDENNADNSDSNWGSIMEKTYGHLGDDKWPSTIKLQDNDGVEVIFEVNLPFSYTEWQDEYLTNEDSVRSEFIQVMEADTVCSTWEKDENGNYLRKITRTQVINFSKFTRTITSESWEAYRMINGKQEYYKTGSTSLSFNPYADHISDISEIVMDSVIYERENNFVGANIKYYTESFEIGANTVIDREIGVIEDDNGDNEKPEEMPTADLTVDKIVKVSNITSSPIYVSIDKVEWHNVSFIETTDKYYVYVDGIRNCSWNKTDLAASDKYNSVVYEPTRKQWIPAVLTVDSEGWDYVCEFVDHSYKQVGVSMIQACSSGIKNFTENNTAEVSPFVKTIIDSRTYNGKQWTKVSGFNVDGNITITYTVAEK